ncbi:hypothetical protein D018_0790B, partial [Vibrio parahaemolyticus VP2007-007]
SRTDEFFHFVEP